MANAEEVRVEARRQANVELNNSGLLKLPDVMNIKHTIFFERSPNTSFNHLRLFEDDTQNVHGKTILEKLVKRFATEIECHECSKHRSVIMAVEHIYRCLNCHWLVILAEALLPSESPCPICKVGKLAYITTEPTKE